MSVLLYRSSSADDSDTTVIHSPSLSDIELEAGSKQLDASFERKTMYVPFQCPSSGMLKLLQASRRLAALTHTWSSLCVISH